MTTNWFQGGDEVTITIFAKNSVKERVTVTLDTTTNTVNAVVPMPDDSVFTRSFHLFGSVNSNTKINISAYKVEFTMTKSDKSTWDALEATGAPVVAAVKRENTYGNGGCCMLSFVYGVDM